MRRTWLVGSAILIALSAAAVLYLARGGCPASGIALRGGVREAARLKNRTALPRPEEFEPRATLAALLEPGEDRARWSEAKAAVVEGYVLEVRPGGVEAANCYTLAGRDTHIHIAPRKDAPLDGRFVLEITPRLREWAARQGSDWSEAALASALTGRLCRFEGWLFFDREHADEAANTAPEAVGNWRATAWEIHPITRIEILDGK